MENKILVETSAHHIHLTQKSLDFLLGAPDSRLVVRKELSQPGMFVSDTRLDLIGPVNPKTGKSRSIVGVSILGPVRSYDQVELSATDARGLGVLAPLRESGNVKGSAPIQIVNPANGKVLNLSEGAIVAQRHIHMAPEDAKAFNVKNGDIVKVEVEGTGRSLVFGDVVIRVSEQFRLAMHIDTDESNAASAGGLIYGKLVK